jgi:hypothetical protein
MLVTSSFPELSVYCPLFYSTPWADTLPPAALAPDVPAKIRKAVDFTAFAVLAKFARLTI